MSVSAVTAKYYPELSLRQGRNTSMSGRVRCSLRRGLSPLLWALLLVSCSVPALAKDSVPDWVRAAAAQTLPTYPEETNAVVLLDDTTYTVAPDGRAVEHHRRVVKILRPQGRDWGIVHVWFDNETKILSMKVWSIGPDEHEYAMKDNEYTDVGAAGESGGFEFEDDKYRVAHAPGADPGGVVAYEYEQRSRPFVTEYTWAFQEEIPSVSQRFSMSLPAGYTYGTTWAHHGPVQAEDLESGRRAWEVKDVPGINLEHVPMSPSPEALAGRMTVHYAGPGLSFATDGTWKSIGEWYWQLSKDRLVATPEIAAKAQQLVAGKTDLYDKMDAIGAFVQNEIRYVAIEVGVGGFQPHAAASVFHNRYGDCKDKATLLSAMLSAVGVHSALMMVDSERGVVDPSAPSLVGDHMIAAIELPAEYSSPRLRSVVTAKNGHRYLIFDPTWEKTPFGQIESNLQGSYGVLLEGPDSQTIQIPLMDPALNTIHRNATFQLSADGGLKGTVTERRFGDNSEDVREIYTMRDAKDQRDWLDRTLRRDLTAFSASDVKVENVGSLHQEMTLTYSLSADRYAKPMGQLLLVRPRVLGSDAMPTERKKRTVPIDLGETMEATNDYSIELPDGYVVDELPDPVKVDMDFAAYQSAVEVKGNTLHYTRTYTVRQVTLPADRYADVQKLVSAIVADEESSAVLKKK
jgi:transglutaminase-like putative cysteine protease